MTTYELAQLELDRPWTDEEAMETGYPHKPIGNDDRMEDIS